MTELELRRKFVSQAQSWLGYKESDNSHRAIIDTYNQIVPLPVNYVVQYTDAWCATFVSAVASKVGITDIVYPECGCDRMITLYQNHNCWVENDAYVPSIGDIIFYDWDDSGSGDNTGSSDHVGIVTAVNAYTLTIIEGNINDMVATRTISVDGKYIRGYGTPNFASKATNTSTTVAVDTAQTIWNSLINGGLSKNGAAAIMGNLYYESGLQPNNLENYYESKLGYTDESYTAAVDGGTYSNFIYDCAGYGLAQWTYYTRKQALLNYVKQNKGSIGDAALQVEYLLKELKESFNSLYTALQGDTDITTLSTKVLKEFENPADSGAAVQLARANKGKEYYNLYHGKTVTPTNTDTKTDTSTTVTTNELGYGSSGTAVEELQLRLVLLGLDVGTDGIDGEYSQSTKQSVISFQSLHGLAADGVCGPLTKAAILKEYKLLEPPSTIYRYGDKSVSIKCMVTLLKYLKYYKLNITDHYNLLVINAVKQFQRAKSLDVDGECGPLTWSALYKEAQNG